MDLRGLFRRRPLTDDERRKRDEAKQAWKDIRKRKREVAWEARTGLPLGPEDPEDEIRG
jgi:hypothetical protein